MRRDTFSFISLIVYSDDCNVLTQTIYEGLNQLTKHASTIAQHYSKMKQTEMERRDCILQA